LLPLRALAGIWRDWIAGRAPARLSGHLLRPAIGECPNTLGTSLAALGQTAEARRAYEGALTPDNTAAYGRNNLCYLEFKAGRFGQARTRCSAAIQLAPEMTAAHNNLALVYAAQGDLESARREFLAAGDNATAAYNVGIVHLAGGDYARAANAFEEAIRERPEFTAAKTRAHSARERVMTGH
jgi:Flp pilus assembly protein TadD